MSTVAQALANVRNAGARVSPVFYDHEPRRPKSAGGPRWHYSLRLPDETDADALIVRVGRQARLHRLGQTTLTKPGLSDGHHVILKSDNALGTSAVLDIIANLLP